MGLPKTLPSYEYLHECFSYNEHTGMLHIKVRPSSHNLTKQKIAIDKKNEGKPLTTFIVNCSTAYYWIRLDGIHYYAHRLIWKMLYNEEPPVKIDHFDGDGLNNTPFNLRDGSCNINAKNRALSCNNTSGYTGVNWNSHAGKWQSKITVDGKQIYLGIFTKIEDAASAYENAKHHYNFTDRHGL